MQIDSLFFNKIDQVDLHLLQMFGSKKPLIHNLNNSEPAVVNKIKNIKI